MFVESITPLLAVLVSLIAGVFIVIFKNKPNIRESCSIIASIIKFLIVISMLPVILNGDKIVYTLFTIIPGIDIKFKVDAFGLFFAITASSLWIITTFYSIGYMRSLKEHEQTRYFLFFAIALSATMGVAFSGNLITLYLFYELLTLSTYPLIIHDETKKALDAGTKYLAYMLTTSILFQLLAIFLVYSITGTIDFSDNGVFSGNEPLTLIAVIFVLFVIGYAKSAMMPLHSWLPTAMIAPTPVSALLHAVAVVKTGVFSIVRVLLFIFGIKLLSSSGLGLIMCYFASFTIILASIFALTQDNLKKRLAYSTVSQLSYIVLGASLLTHNGIIGGIIHIVNHGFSKITLFFCAGSIYIASKKKNISELNGIGRKMPLTMAAFSIAVLSMIGIPPACGFLSKWYLALGSIESDNIPILIVILLSALLNAAYFLPIVYVAYFKSPDNDGEMEKVKEPSYFVVIPLLITAIVSLILFFAPSIFMDLIKITLRNMGV